MLKTLLQNKFVPSKYVLLTVILTSTFLSYGCDYFRRTQDSISTVNIALTSSISTLDPVNSYDTVSATVIYQSYESLYEYHYLKRPYEIRPLLATDLPHISDDGLVYTIKIRENIFYHPNPVFDYNTRTVTAQDFITQIKRLAFVPLNSNGWWLFDGRIKGLNEFREKAGESFEKLKTLEVEGLKAIDEHTLQITLTRPYPQMINALAMTFTAPIPIELLEYYQNDLSQAIVGTGAFKLDYLDKNNLITMTRFKNYHESFYPTQGDRLANSRGFLRDAGRRIPFVDKVNFHIVKDTEERWQMFLDGKIDYIDLPKDHYASAITPTGRLSNELRNKGIELQIVPSLTFWWLSFNMNDPLIGENYYLRKAIAHAIDVDQYIEIFTGNIGQRANSIYLPGISGYDPTSVPPYHFNLERARKYLTKAGFPNGEGLPTIEYNVRGAGTNHQKQADFIKHQLSRINISVKPVLNQFTDFLEKSRTGTMQFWLDGWALDYPDAENILQLLYSQNHAPGPNATFYHNPQFDKYFLEFQTLADGARKEELMKKLEEIALNDIPWILLYYSREYLLHHSYLHNYRQSDIIYNFVKYLRIEN